jgi:hypothetical protein
MGTHSASARPATDARGAGVAIELGRSVRLRPNRFGHRTRPTLGQATHSRVQQIWEAIGLDLSQASGQPSVTSRGHSTAFCLPTSSRH